jgi:hypothetical protein
VRSAMPMTKFPKTEVGRLFFTTGSEMLGREESCRVDAKSALHTSFALSL